jgi:pimeloyl-ACP methyl ester carboxylesterase
VTDVGRRAAELVEQSEVHLVPGGHAPWLDDPVAVADHVRSFLARFAGAER